MRKIFFVLVFVFNFSSAYANELAVEDPLTEPQLKGVIQQGVKWLKNSQEKNGHFRYEYMPFWDRYVNDDNIVRQTGALYVLGEVAIKSDSFDLKRNMERALGYLVDNSADSTFNGYEFRCLLRTAQSCNLGGTSLGLVGVLDLVTKYPNLEDDYKPLIEDYKNFIMAMKIPDKGFRGAYHLDKEQSDSESPFSNGEALLALVRYYLYEPSDDVKKVIDESLEYFIATYSEKWDPNFYLWGMAAIKDYYKLFPRQEYFDFVKDYTKWRIAGQKDQRKTSHNKCAYIEGVISAYSVLNPSSSLAENESYLEEINFWLKKSSKLQIKKADVLTVNFNEGIPKFSRILKPARAVGGFLTDENEPFQRIDFTQHCLSSYLQKLVDIDGEKL